MSGVPDPGFRLLWTGETASALGTSVSRLALPLVAVLTLDASTVQVSLLTAATWLPWLLVGLPAGAWVDRHARRPLMVACDVVSLAVLVTVPAAAALGVLTYAHLLVVSLLLGASSVLFSTAYAVYLPTLVGAERLPAANARLQGSEAAAQVAGPGIAGAVTAAVGAVGGLLLDAVSFAVSAVCLARVRVPEPPPSPGSGDGWRAEVRAGVRFLAGDPYLRVLAVYGAASNLALTGYQAVLVVFLVREVGASPATVGALLSGASAGGLLGAAVATTLARHLGGARAMLLAGVAAGPFALLVPLAAPGPRLLLVVVSGLGVGAAVVAGNVLKGSFRQAYTPRELLGRVVVAMQLLNYGTIPLGAVLGGVLGTALGLRPTVWLMVVAVALAPVLLLVGPLSREREFPVSPAGAAAPATSPAGR